jgi:hypothetical protein
VETGLSELGETIWELRAFDGLSVPYEQTTWLFARNLLEQPGSICRAVADADPAKRPRDSKPWNHPK